MNNDAFVNDPIFTPLRSFATAPATEQQMPASIRQAFDKGFAVRKRKRYWWRGSLSAFLVFASVPAFAATHVLPAPIQKVVEKVNTAVTTSVHHLVFDEPKVVDPEPSVIKTNNGNLKPPKIKETKIKETKIKPVKVKSEKIKPEKAKQEKVKPEKIKDPKK